MKTKQTITGTVWNSLLLIFLGALLAGQAHGQIYVTTNDGTVGEYDSTTGATINPSLVSYYPSGAAGIVVAGGNLWVMNYFANAIGEYDATTGAAINPSLVPVVGSYFMAVSGGNLFVANLPANSIGEYDAATGATINPSLVSGLNEPTGVAVSERNLFVVNTGANTIGKYDATTGATINPSLVSGLNEPFGVAVSGGNLFVVNTGANTIGKYDAETGATINASLVSGLSFPFGVVVSGGNLFVVNNASGTIGEYNATTGATVNPSLVSGLNGPFGISLGGNVSVFATGLEYPRGLKFGPDRQLYVAEAGSGGTMSTAGTCDQVIPPVGPYLGGFTSRISKVASDGTVTTVADNLPSGINALGDVLGIADVAFIGRALYALSSGGGCSHGFANNDASILRVNPDGTTRSIADLSVFQKAHPVKNPNPLDFEPDGSWYSMITVGNLIRAVEPNHGELDLIHTDGRIRRIADISASQGHIVPTAVAYDGVNFYVGNLGTFPIVDGSEVILKITPSGKVKTFATGFTTILGLAFDSHGKLYVLENTTGGNQFPTPGTGKILRLSSDGTQTEIATGLNLPTAMTFGADGNIYVSSWGFGPPAMGEIDKVTVSK